MSDKPDLDRIRSQFQVQDDEMIQYHPRLAGKVDIPFSPTIQVTRTEGKLLDEMTWSRGLQGLLELKETHDLAFRESKQHVPDQPVPDGIPNEQAEEWQLNDGHRDAFRHTYWNALLAKEFGNEWAQAFATAHEGRPGNPANREAMDLYNNQVGRGIAAAHPSASKEQLAQLVGDAMKEGKLILMDHQGKLAWSDQVQVGQHGLSPEDAIQPHLQTPAVVPAAPRTSGFFGANAPGDQGLTPEDPSHPRYALHQQCKAGVGALDQQLGRASDEKSACMAASLTNLAVTNGLERVDHVLLSDQAKPASLGQNVFIVQGELSDPAHLRAHMSADQAISTPVEASFLELAQVEQRNVAMQSQQALTQQQDEHVKAVQRV
ncbi:XVIPCD domain-containing protein [Xanthomonas campestris pv. raphani]|uniref:XVIPCD domain-containing protein n=1 Tax=Xanthomonas campestris TaxID=339 RepID=UPI002B22C58D|nr:XVIPCD domain-containing protein [Xanthomonas campestris]MEA9772674.1 XVIPCD domain-containing protein [Xanthomonas campestris pv. raphani]MEA9800853.1 XVIPCD domain-containing protein [Xanthomonas campestris pv. raphani]MEA9832948.1 XVIPCD domain-containing protein [Xanthomonas campestris pv. raphani]MEA9953412.1 XVIPCD domain-containing protein [Xanthomonas campestris pv. raphani]